MNQDLKKISKMIFPVWIVMLLVLPSAGLSLNDVYDNSDLWVTPDRSGYSTDVYYHIDRFTTCFWIWCSESEIHTRIGSSHYEWFAEYIESDSPSHDFWALHIILTVTPATVEHDSDENVKYDQQVKFYEVTFDVGSSSAIADTMPTRTGGSSSSSFGVGAGLSGDNRVVRFSASQSQSHPDVDIDPYTDFSFGGFHEWDVDIRGFDAERDQHTIHYTAMFRVNEDQSMSTDITIEIDWEYQYMNWHGNGYSYPTAWDTAVITFSPYVVKSGGGGGCNIQCPI